MDITKYSISNEGQVVYNGSYIERRLALEYKGTIDDMTLKRIIDPIRYGQLTDYGPTGTFIDDFRNPYDMNFKS